MDVLKHLLIVLILVAMPSAARAQNPPQPTATATTASPEKKPTFEIYGFTMLDMGFNFEQINSNWFDTMRVTRLPKFYHEFGEDQNTFAGVRQSRYGVKSSKET